MVSITRKQSSDEADFSKSNMHFNSAVEDVLSGINGIITNTGSTISNLGHQFSDQNQGGSTGGGYMGDTEFEIGNERDTTKILGMPKSIFWGGIGVLVITAGVIIIVKLKKKPKVSIGK